MQKIQTSIGLIMFRPYDFSNPKPINKEIAKENLLLFQKIMNRHNISFSLAYGTLLGAIRENDFITHDEDIDVAILDEDRQKLIDSLHDFIKNDFSIGRYEKDLLSVFRKDEYIDIYIFRKKPFGYRQFNNEVLKEKYLLNTIKYDFKDSQFNIPKEYLSYLKDHYGEDWKKPVKNSHACNPSLYLKIKTLIQKHAKPLFQILSKVKKAINDDNK